MSHKNKDKKIADLEVERPVLMAEKDDLIRKIWNLQARNAQLVEEIKDLRKKMEKY